MGQLRFRAKVDPLSQALHDPQMPEDCFFGLRTQDKVVRVPVFLLLARGGNLRGLVRAARSQGRAHLDLEDWSLATVQCLASYVLYGYVRIHFTIDVAVELFDMGQ